MTPRGGPTPRVRAAAAAVPTALIWAAGALPWTRCWTRPPRRSNELERYTNVAFVGEPTASRVNFFADNRKILLPHSGVNVRASYLRIQHMHPLDSRRWTAPHIEARLSSSDYRMNIDPAMEAVRRFEP